MLKIPKIIHQIWLSKDNTEPKPFLKYLAQTWKKNNPKWEYMYWDNEKVDKLLKEDYPKYYDIFYNIKFIIQKCDFIRCLILYKYGGLYIDLDFASVKSIEPLIQDHDFFITEEPASHSIMLEYFHKYYLTNAFIATIPKHPFILNIIKSTIKNLKKINIEIFKDRGKDQMLFFILYTTGPLFISELYNNYCDKESIQIIKSSYLTPFDKLYVNMILNKSLSLKTCIKKSEKLTKTLKKNYHSYGLHYFFSDWVDVPKKEDNETNNNKITDFIDKIKNLFVKNKKIK
jgi:mannosyltransferase OCH1-like enzyme